VHRAFLAVSMQPVVECCKCGAKIPAPGRMAYWDGETMRFWCDCVTEEEMNEIALDFDHRRQLELLEPETQD